MSLRRITEQIVLGANHASLSYIIRFVRYLSFCHFLSAVLCDSWIVLFTRRDLHNNTKEITNEPFRSGLSSLLHGG
jgi:hypothetical protein